MSCYNTNCSGEPTAEHPLSLTATASRERRHSAGLRHFGRSLMAITQRRQAGRARLGRLLDAGWTGAATKRKRPSKNEATPARSEQ